MIPPVVVREVATAAERRAFVDLAWAANRGDPHWAPPLKSEVRGLLDARKNPWFEHAEAALFLAWRGKQPVGRISAQVDRLVLEHVAPDLGHWGFLEAADPDAAHALLAAAENWLRARGMRRAQGPFSFSYWDEAGLLVQGHDHPPTVMMGHNSPAYAAYVESAGYEGVKDLRTYDLDITIPLRPIVHKLVELSERNPRIRFRQVDKSRFDEEAAIIMGILNDAWARNWGFVPMTPAEIAYVGRKLKPIVFEDLIRIAEYDGEPAAFMITVPDLNELTRDMDGKLLPFGWAKLLWRLRRPQVRAVRVPLMGVLRKYQQSRLASQLTFPLIEFNRRASVERYGATRGEIGWVLDDNEGMKSVAQVTDSRVNKVYRIYERAL